MSKVVMAHMIAQTDPTPKPLRSLGDAIAFDSGDWADMGRASAWIYGIVLGWDESMPDVAKKFGWDAAAQDRLVALHHQFAALEAAERAATS